MPSLLKAPELSYSFAAYFGWIQDFVQRRTGRHGVAFFRQKYTTSKRPHKFLVLIKLHYNQGAAIPKINLFPHRRVLHYIKIMFFIPGSWGSQKISEA